MSAIEYQLNALTIERRGYAARVEQLARLQCNPVEINAYLDLIARVNEAMIALARRSGF